VGGNACALGSAHKALWACERKRGESFEDLIAARWEESDFVTKGADGYLQGLFEQYGEGVEGLEAVEQLLLQGQGLYVSKAGLV